MARFINTRKAVSEIEDLIRAADANRYLVSPYLKLSKDFRQLLAYRNSKDLITNIIFGKQALKPDEMRFLTSLRMVVLWFNEDLHAKCYANDTKMVITSLNLYQFSMANNKEMGVLIDATAPEDAQMFKDAMDEVNYIKTTSQRVEFSAPEIGQDKPETIPRVANPKPKTKAARKKTKDTTGYCIRSGVEVTFNVDKPFSAGAYKIWSRYADPEYTEKFCHFSGEDSEGKTSASRPILRKNWNKARKLHDF